MSSIENTNTTIDVYRVALAPWSPDVAEKDGNIYLEVRGGHYCRVYSADAEVSGLYGSYYEGVFIWYKTASGKLVIGWQGHLVDIADIGKVIWQVKAKGRSFECVTPEGEVLMAFWYHTLKQYRFRPLKFLLDEILFPDEWWGLTSDLPSFIDSCMKQHNVEERHQALLDRYNRIGNVWVPEQINSCQL